MLSLDRRTGAATIKPEDHGLHICYRVPRDGTIELAVPIKKGDWRRAEKTLNALRES